ncbi:MAG TPA: SurA N-terminal domain-containing protein [Terracidiphilus sp.]|nr:SurA N-terminal domain-containing protein [Terracidiphilus sp.]
MTSPHNLGRSLPSPHALRAALLAGLALAASAALLAQPAKSSEPVVLDRVVAVVNDHPILSSDLKEEIQLSVLEPRDSEREEETPEQALQRLISRTLIRQQIREEDAQTTEPTEEEVQARLAEIRKQLPECVREGCSTDAEWSAFLERHGLTQRRVESYLRNRLQILRFIEMRFRQGIRISEQEVAAYYHDTLLPQYPAGQPAPPLSQVAPRIQEILLQQRVNAMFDDWLDNLRQQGEVEVLDPTLVAAAKPDHGGAGSQ